MWFKNLKTEWFQASQLTFLCPSLLLEVCCTDLIRWHTQGLAHCLAHQAHCDYWFSSPLPWRLQYLSCWSLPHSALLSSLCPTSRHTGAAFICHRACPSTLLRSMSRWALSTADPRRHSIQRSFLALCKAAPDLPQSLCVSQCQQSLHGDLSEAA